MPNGWGFDLSLNLFSEVFGIVITVFIVDKIIKKRVGKQWTPLRELLYAQIVYIIDEIYETTLTERFRKPVRERRSYEFEHTTAYSKIEPNTEVILDLNFQNFIQDEADSAYFTNLLARLPEIRNEINNIVQTSTSVIEPKLLERLIRMNNQLRDIIEKTDNIQVYNLNKVMVGVCIVSLLADTYMMLGYLQDRVKKA